MSMPVDTVPEAKQAELPVGKDFATKHMRAISAKAGSIYRCRKLGVSYGSTLERPAGTELAPEARDDDAGSNADPKASEQDAGAEGDGPVE